MGDRGPAGALPAAGRGPAVSLHRRPAAVSRLAARAAVANLVWRAAVRWVSCSGTRWGTRRRAARLAIEIVRPGWRRSTYVPYPIRGAVRERGHRGRRLRRVDRDHGARVAGPASAGPATEAPASGAPSEAPAAGTPKEGGTLVVAIPGDIKRTDPALIDDTNTSYVVQHVMEALVTLKPGTGGDIIPGLAESWTICPDGLTYTFKLRQGVKFHDGTTLDAAAVKSNFDRWLNIPKAYVDLGYTYYIDTVITPARRVRRGAGCVDLRGHAQEPELGVPDPADADPVRDRSPTALEAGGANAARLQAQHVRHGRHAGDGRHRPVQVQGLDPRRPREPGQEPRLLEHGRGRPVPRPDHLQADRRHDGHAQRAAVG